MTTTDISRNTPPTRSSRIALLGFCILAVVVTACVWSGLSIRDLLAVVSR